MYEYRQCIVKQATVATEYYHEYGTLYELVRMHPLQCIVAGPVGTALYVGRRRHSRLGLFLHCSIIKIVNNVRFRSTVQLPYIENYNIIW